MGLPHKFTYTISILFIGINLLFRFLFILFILLLPFYPSSCTDFYSIIMFYPFINISVRVYVCVSHYKNQTEKLNCTKTENFLSVDYYIVSVSS